MSADLRTYRLRGIPKRYKKAVLKRALGLEDEIEITIRSFAKDPQHNRDFIATLEFSETPSCLHLEDGMHSWTFPLPSDDETPVGKARLTCSMTLDTRFDGLTPLHRAGDQDCFVGCVAVTGLNAHAFGSFKARGGNFMWLRDKLPHDFDHARIFANDYDTQLLNSISFQSISDLATTFRQTLRVMRSQPSASDRSLVLIGHSLGGILIKQVSKLITLISCFTAHHLPGPDTDV